MAFWNRWFKKESKLESTQPNTGDRELVKQWLQSVNDSLLIIREELHKIPSETAAACSKGLVESNREILRKLDEVPDKITGPLKDAIALLKQEILTELVRISSHYDFFSSYSLTEDFDGFSFQMG
jgi:hypothetical protein